MDETNMLCGDCVDVPTESYEICKNACCEKTSRTDDMFHMLQWIQTCEESVVYKKPINANAMYASLLQGQLPSYTALSIFLNISYHQLLDSIQHHGQLMKIKTADDVCIFGDIHGQFDDLCMWFQKLGYPSRRSKRKYVFLGDYVDRGTQDVEVALLLLLLRFKHPSKIVLLRGNHESLLQNGHYGFQNSCKKHYGIDKGMKLWRQFNKVFDCLPRSALIDESTFCMHGGLSPSFMEDSFARLEELSHFKHDHGHDAYGVLTDLYWADPKHMTVSWKENPRGISFEFNKDVVDAFHTKFKTRLIVRAHQVVNGIEKFSPGLMTVFSAPKYQGLNNKGAVLCLKPNGSYTVIWS